MVLSRIWQFAVLSGFGGLPCGIVAWQGCARPRPALLPAQDDKSAFAQLTVRVRAAHKFVARDAAGAVVAGDARREVPVQDVWVLERYLQPGPTSRWRVAGEQWKGKEGFRQELCSALLRLIFHA